MEAVLTFTDPMTTHPTPPAPLPTTERLRELAARMENAARRYRDEAATFLPLSNEASARNVMASDCEATAAALRAVIAARTLLNYPPTPVMHHNHIAAWFNGVSMDELRAIIGDDQ